MIRLKYILILLFCLTASTCWGQAVVGSRAVEKESLQQVSDAIERGESDEAVAESYEKLAKDLSAKGEHAKAEDYLNRARKLYEKLKDTEKIARVDRELAKAQEAQNKLDAAFRNYKSASKLQKGKTLGAVNENDAQRVLNFSNPQAQTEYIQQNLDYFNNTNDTKGIVEARQQMAGAYRDMNKPDEAIYNYNVALGEVKDRPELANQIKMDIASVYAESKQLDKAIEINKDLIADARKLNDTKTEIKQLQTLSTNYIEANKQEEGISVLQEAYSIAIDKGQTLDAKNSLELLVEQYKRIKQPQKALEAYADFVGKLENLVKGDSTLIDEKFFQVQEEKILQLEKERALKDELITKQNTFNYVLIAVIILILIFLLLIAKALYSIKKKNKRIALQSLRREMNPHFIFNSLNSVNQFIAQNNELEANKYLSSYSKLMRNIMENSNKDFVSLSAEMEQIKEYLDLEHMRFHDKFDFRIDIDETIDPDATFIPNMLIQPQLENAIWHGLRYKDTKGFLTLTVETRRNELLIVIEDNGIGLKKSQELKTKHQREHNSRGLNNTHERIKLLNSLYGTNISIDISEKEGGTRTGVIVVLSFPVMNKNML
ncbi:two-component system sensor histidine kinase YesM [Dysgonomonas sp. PFB1-18]|uniref:tetratricopeptide repeat-containing sensor histidine kinase n=1 Tax=unclassified Dysgonomonas TaxID=2630389 RepID=UPI0024763ADE|nr:MULTISPECIES: histidine kinase [unclassified Dysgonomonas]MDH6308152.1 two-component system sensor histidine kinase YesM [Dysgonomonas sp. PF1-14]MDH6338409.1 two-component system sensor histidine kinase YesM [Dysgonomonas sp. PF1-16]MDH6379906.1 two-component system sensor histidine kinase YesM [Dysgonomonas sp. PFB1-18]MDH6397004.1 two-component system sensor histidine kinase YesM [Dysgonomonas sp. PF1-23]